MKSQTLKVISFAELIIGIIVSIAAGVIFKTVDTESVLISEVERAIASFNYSLALNIFISVIMLFIILYALYSILSNIEAIRAAVTDEKPAELSNKITNDLEKSANSKITVKTAKAQSPEAKFAERFYWVCDNCLELNSKGTTVCSKCGNQKDVT